MNINVKQVLDIVGEKQVFAAKLDLSQVKRYGEVLFPEPLAVSGEVSNRAGIVTLRYQIKGEVPFKCHRCLMQSILNLDEEFIHTVVTSLEDEEQDDVFLTAPLGVLCIDEIANTDLQLSLPHIMLCNENCQGLCPICGSDLNKNECQCKPETGHSGLAQLRKLLTD